ncbi:MAG: preprotein translocase subunit SecY [Christensenellaceae bacterium]|jgi:preprotein translocase subunit SecY
MFKTLGNAWKIEDLRKKILYTLMMLLIYRLGTIIPVPGVNVAYIKDMVSEYTALGFLNMMSGGGLESMSIFALGISPYLNASIIMNLLTIAIPALERMSKDGDDGPKKISKITRYVAVALGLVQALGIILGLGTSAVASTDLFNYVTIILCLTAGTAFIMWLGEKINENGIGNGISLIIFIGLVAGLPSQLIGLVTNVVNGAISVVAFVVLILAVLIVVTAITFVDMGERRVPVQYAKRVVGRKMYGGQSTFIPIKVNQSGVMPLIFAMTFVQFPAMLMQIFWSNSGAYAWYTKFLGTGSIVYAVLYAALIIFFTYFYAQIAFNPVDVSKNIQQYGGFVPGIRPGKPTSDYLAKILSRLTLFGAVFLALIAAVPTLLQTLGGTSAFTATGLLIMVNVALETAKSLEAQMMMRHYKGFLR